MPQRRRTRSSAIPQKVAPEASGSKVLPEPLLEISVSDNSESKGVSMGPSVTEVTADVSQEETLKENGTKLELEEAAHGIAVESSAEETHSNNQDKNQLVTSPRPSNVIELSCQICNCSFTNYHEHMNSEAHKASRNSNSETGSNSDTPSVKLQAQKRLGGQGAEKSFPPKKKLKSEQGGGKFSFSCDVCKITINRKVDFDLHLQGKRHNITVQKMSGRVHCDCCNLFFNTTSELNEHSDSLLHKNNVAGKKVNTEEGFFCDICQVTSVGQRRRTEHLESRRHKSMLSKQEGSPMTQKKWIYVCNGCNYFTNDDELLKSHMDKATHKTAVTKMKEAGLMCGTPVVNPGKAAGGNSPQVIKAIEPKSNAKPSSGGDNPKPAVIAKEANASAVSNSSSVVAPQVASKPIQSGITKTNIASVVGTSTQSAVGSTKTKEQIPKLTFDQKSKILQPQIVIKPLSSVNTQIFSNRFSSIGGNFNTAAKMPHLESNSGPIFNVGNHGPNVRSNAQEAFSFGMRAQMSAERPRLAEDLRGDYRSNTGERFDSGHRVPIRDSLSAVERDVPRDDYYYNRVPKDVHSNLTGDLRSDFRSSNAAPGVMPFNPRKDVPSDFRNDMRGELNFKDFPGGVGNDMRGNYHSGLRNDGLAGLRDELQRRDLRDLHRDFPRDSRGDLRGDSHSELRRDFPSSFPREMHSNSTVDYRLSKDLGAFHSGGSSMKKDDRLDGMGNVSKGWRVEPPRDSRENLYLDRSALPSYSNRASYDDDYRFNSRAELGPSRTSQSSGYMSAPRTRDVPGGGHYVSQYATVPLNQPFASGMSFGGR